MAVAEKALTFVWFAVVLGASAVVVLALLPFSPVRTAIPEINEERLTEITPQGWGFFTKDPQEERLTIYRMNEAQEWENFTQNNSAATNFFGMSRKARIRGLELSNLLENHGETVDAAWAECGSQNISECLQRADELKVLKVDNSYTVRTLCGPVILAQQAPNPWAYYQAGFENGNPVSMVRLDVNCGV